MAEFSVADETTAWKFSEQEEKVLAYWRAIDAFQESLRQSKGRPIYSFYDGPPFATGLPHHGHILMGTIKDIVTRFAHANGYYVERRFGWDTHGLPVEHEIDKKLGVKSRDDVMRLGIDKYNAECRAIVMRYSSEWRKTVERLGRWIDFDNDYKTLDPRFMESVWWVFGELWKKGLVYRGYRVMPYTTGCTTPLSNFEAGLDYREVPDPAVFVALPLLSDKDVSLVAWTTTPWTLPMNLALAVNPQLVYAKVEEVETGKKYILAEGLLKSLWKDVKKVKVLEKFPGAAMAGWDYDPLFTYYEAKYKPRGCFRVTVDEYVAADTGSGIVHQAPAFGEDDYNVAVKNGIISKDEEPPLPFTDDGRFTSEVPELEGLYFKDADKEVIKILKEKGRMVSVSQIRHSYPFCWRSGTPLMYRAVPAWFVRVADHQEEFVAANKETRWVPQSVGDTRFQNWLAQARDWNISRNRYWGTPLPVWANEDYSEIVCISSVKELEELSGVSVTDLHRDSIDGITIPSKKGNGERLHRVEEVFDCWFESGSMPYAQQHYPFEHQDKFTSSFPADFVAEAIDQTRGWFYTLLVLGVLLFGKAPWKNLIVCGHVLAADGKKMSKSLKNYPDPTAIIDTYGSDALRLFLINSPVVRGDALRFKEEGVREVNTHVLLPYVNAYKFFIGHAKILEQQTGARFVYDPARKPVHVMDKWIIARCMSLTLKLKEEMDAYRLYTVVPQVLGLVEELTNWYIRMNRLRLKGHGGPEDTLAALHALYEALFALTRMLAPFVPFTTENVYQGLRVFIDDANRPADLGTDLRSVHFLPYPEIRTSLMDPDIERRVARMQDVIELARVIRDRHTLPLKQPLKSLVVFAADPEYIEDVRSLEGSVAQELNVVNVIFTNDESACGIKYHAVADWPSLGRKLRKDAPLVKKALPEVPSDAIKEFARTGSITVAGKELDSSDLNVVRSCVSDDPGLQAFAKELGASFDSNSDASVVVLLDTAHHADLVQAGTARELINRVQRLRKKAGLTATDDVAAFYRFVDDAEYVLDAVIRDQASALERVLKTSVPVRLGPGAAVERVFVQEEQEVGEDKFELLFAWRSDDASLEAERLRRLDLAK